MNLRNFLATSESLSRESAREVLQFDPSANAAEQVLLQFKQAGIDSAFQLREVGTLPPKR